jgi:putative transcriptional regulator
MRKIDITQVTVKAGEELPRGETDWARVRAMTEEETAVAAKADPDAQPLARRDLNKMRRVSRVKVLRQRLAMTQAEFAAAFRLPLGTVRDWEQGRSVPDAPARALLEAIQREPETMRRLLGRAA